MENLLKLLNENLERVEKNLWAEWLNDDHKEVLEVSKMLKALDLGQDVNKELLEAERNGLVRLSVDDQALLVEVL